MRLDDNRCETCGVPYCREHVDVPELDRLARQLEQAEREKERALKDLAEIHAYNCGCDQPGRLDVCVAQPVVLFAALSEQNT